MAAKAVKSAKPEVIAEITRGLERALGGKVGGKVVLGAERFYVGGLEAHLLSEGMRKIASIVRLLANNELRERGVLFWDEPEANLNPQLSVVVAEVLMQLAGHGIQIFVATHDYLLSESLGLSAKAPGAPKARFFSFTRNADKDSVTIDGSDELDGLKSNLIRQEFLRHYDRVRNAE